MKNVVIYLDSLNDQFFSGKKAVGVKLKKGKNTISEKEYESIKDGVWFTHLLKEKILVVEGEEKIIKEKSVNKLHKMMDKEKDEAVKVKIADKIQKVVDKEV